MADVACAPERFKVAMLLTLGVDGSIQLSRFCAKESSATEALGLLHTSLSVYEGEAADGFGGGESDECEGEVDEDD